MGNLDVVAAMLLLVGSSFVLYTVRLVDALFTRPADAQPQAAQEDASYRRAA